jgi:hypothetical protein
MIADPFLRDEHVDDLTVLVDHAVQVDPPASDFDVGLVYEPPIPPGACRQGRRVDQQWGEPLDPAVDRDVINGDAAFVRQRGGGRHPTRQVAFYYIERVQHPDGVGSWVASAVA